MADYHSPRPVDPLWYRYDAYLRIDCFCGRRLQAKLRDFAKVHRLHRSIQLYKMILRLRCKQCGRRPLHADVVL